MGAQQANGNIVHITDTMDHGPYLTMPKFKCPSAFNFDYHAEATLRLFEDREEDRSNDLILLCPFVERRDDDEGTIPQQDEKVPAANAPSGAALEMVVEEESPSSTLCYHHHQSEESIQEKEDVVAQVDNKKHKTESRTLKMLSSTTPVEVVAITIEELRRIWNGIYLRAFSAKRIANLPWDSDEEGNIRLRNRPPVTPKLPWIRTVSMMNATTTATTNSHPSIRQLFAGAVSSELQRQQQHLQQQRNYLPLAVQRLGSTLRLEEPTTKPKPTPPPTTTTAFSLWDTLRGKQGSFTNNTVGPGWRDRLDRERLAIVPYIHKKPPSSSSTPPPAVSTTATGGGGATVPPSIWMLAVNLAMVAIEQQQQQSGLYYTTKSHANETEQSTKASSSSQRKRRQHDRDDLVHNSDYFDDHQRTKSKRGKTSRCDELRTTSGVSFSRFAAQVARARAQQEDLTVQDDVATADENDTGARHQDQQLKSYSTMIGENAPKDENAKRNNIDNKRKRRKERQARKKEKKEEKRKRSKERSRHREKKHKTPHLSAKAGVENNSNSTSKPSTKLLEKVADNWKQPPEEPVSGDSPSSSQVHRSLGVSSRKELAAASEDALYQSREVLNAKGRARREAFSTSKLPRVKTSSRHHQHQTTNTATTTKPKIRELPQSRDLTSRIVNGPGKPTESRFSQDKPHSTNNKPGQLQHNSLELGRPQSDRRQVEEQQKYYHSQQYHQGQQLHQSKLMDGKRHDGPTRPSIEDPQLLSRRHSDALEAPKSSAMELQQQGEKPLSKHQQPTRHGQLVSSGREPAEKPAAAPQPQHSQQRSARYANAASSANQQLRNNHPPPSQRTDSGLEMSSERFQNPGQRESMEQGNQNNHKVESQFTNTAPDLSNAPPYGTSNNTSYQQQLEAEGRAGASVYSTLPPVQVLCSEGFLDNWGDIVAQLGSGRWPILERQNGKKAGPMAGMAVELVDSPLVDDCGVDIELPNRCAAILYSASAFTDEADARQIVTDVAKHAADGVYRRITVFLCYDVPITSDLAHRIIQLQTAPICNGTNLPTHIFFKSTSLKSLSAALAQTVFFHLRQTSSSASIPPPVSAAGNRPLCERARFLKSVLPLSASGALQCLQLIQYLAPNTNSLALLFTSQKLRDEIMAAALSTPPRAAEIHPESVAQLVVALRAPLGRVGVLV